MTQTSTEDRPNTAVQHSAATLRALEASRELIERLKDCEKAVYQLHVNIDSDSLDLVGQVSENLASAGVLAELLQCRVKRFAHESSGFWEPAAGRIAVHPAGPFGMRESGVSRNP